MLAIAPGHRPSVAACIGQAALCALYAEVCLSPKPGLVSRGDNGSHDDMDIGLFIRSLIALRPYFPAIARAGAWGAPFEVLRRLGVVAEALMMEATGGVNVHRGAIFSLGLLAAAAGWRRHGGRSLRGSRLGETVAERWGADILAAAPLAPRDAALASRRHGAAGARQEAAAGFPALFDAALPCLKATLRETGCARRSLIQTLFAIMAVLDDTNLLRRGGEEGLRHVQESARAFLDADGVLRAGWEDRVIALHRSCVERRLSPGGSADMLAAAWFVHLLRSE